MRSKRDLRGMMRGLIKRSGQWLRAFDRGLCSYEEFKAVIADITVRYDELREEYCDKISIPGTRVRMSAELKQDMIYHSKAHIEEFGNCVGVVIGLVDYGTQKGPEVDVRWQPSNLKYMYNPAWLIEARS